MNFSRSTFKSVFVFLSLLLVLAISLSAVQAAGEVDPTFNAAVQDTTAGSVQTIFVQPDGKLLVGGYFTVANNTARTALARFNSDGTIDPTFVPPDFYKLTAINTYSIREVSIYAIALLADGKVIVSGDFSRVGNIDKKTLVRLNADGSLDNSFNVSFYEQYGESSAVYNIKIQSDNQIIISGIFRLTERAADRYGLARLNADGSTDNSFLLIAPSGIVRNVDIQPDGKIIYGLEVSSNSFSVRRINPNGSPDASFAEVLFQGNGTANSAFVNKIVLQPDGKVLVGGLFRTVNSFAQNNLTRLNTDGTLDASFNVNGAGADQKVNDVSVLPDGKIIISGLFNSYNNMPRTKTARLNADGTLDSTIIYSPGNSAVVNAVTSLGDGRVVIGGNDFTGNWDKLSRLNTDGSLDTTFVGAIYQRGVVYKVLTQPDGKILIGGAFYKVNGIPRRHIARLNQDGSVDAGFVANAQAGVLSLALQSDGKILAVGPFTSINGVYTSGLARLNQDGSVDTTLLPSGYDGLDEVVVLSDGKILIAGNLGGSGSQTIVAARLNSNGSVDTTFNQVTATPAPGSGFQQARALEIQTNGKILIGGAFIQINGVARGRIARLNADGTLDGSFNPPFGANGAVNDLAVQSNGSVVIGGEFTGVNGDNTHSYLARLNSDGTLDASYNPTISGSPYPFIYAVERQSDDKILIGGAFGIVNGVQRYGLARLNQNGSIDNSFGGTGTNAPVYDIFVQADNVILIGGEFTRVNGISRIGVARLLNASVSGRTMFDFDGDGRADISVFRPSGGFWYELRSQNNSFYALQFGQSSDNTAPADYDGDGRTDIAVFRDNVPGAGSQAYFYITNSSDNSFRFAAFGTQGDVPMSGDWDGDGIDDIAVYRAATTAGGQSYFFYRPSSQPGVDFRAIPWGTAGDKPVRGDFDGDGKLDAAVFRSSNASWYVLQSSNNQFSPRQFGLPTDIPVPADYDGDGKTDIAVFRPSTGYWFTSIDPQTNYGAVHFGANGDVPVPADYDGDGRADVAVYRPSNGTWYLLQSTNGFTGVQFGTTVDKPIPNVYIR